MPYISFKKFSKSLPSFEAIMYFKKGYMAAQRESAFDKQRALYNSREENQLNRYSFLRAKEGFSAAFDGMPCPEELKESLKESSNWLSPCLIKTVEDYTATVAKIEKALQETDDSLKSDPSGRAINSKNYINKQATSSKIEEGTHPETSLPPLRFR